ncbi:MAG: hypothetical protein R3Y38_03390 [Rikenellaceae bacterium]
MRELKKYDEHQLKKILDKYPYFTLARMALDAKSEGGDKLISLLRRVGVISLAESLEIEEQTASNGATDSIIDNFLAIGDYKITPSSESPDEDLTLGDDPLEDDDIVSEELAKILLLQGLNLQAKQMYLKLSLLYPKKSVYFAEIISKIEVKE